jgi:hypothetical protein
MVTTVGDLMDNFTMIFGENQQHEDEMNIINRYTKNYK